jgi:hypothetical protein
MGSKIVRRHRNLSRAAVHLERLLRVERQRLLLDYLATFALLLIGMAGFYWTSLPRMVQVICLACAALAAMTTFTDYRLTRSHRGELAALRRTTL